MPGPNGGCRVSVVIPTRNAGPRFVETLRALAAQDLGEPHEVLVVDSGSTDETLSLCAAHGVRVLEVPPTSFGHGRTRNEAIAACSGIYVALTVQDAIPADGQWLAALVNALDNHPAVAGAYSRHLPHPEASYVATRVTQFWHERVGGPVEQRLNSTAAFDLLPLQEKQYACTFNNVSSMVRRAVWEAQPFPEVRYAEDLAWGYAVLREGHALLYVPESEVYHSHDRPAEYELKRAYVEARAVGELFGEPALPLAVPQAEALLADWRDTVEGLTPERAAGALAQWRDGVDDLSAAFRSLLGQEELAAIFGPHSRYPEGERERLLEQILVAQRESGRQTAPDPNHRPGALREVWGALRRRDARGLDIALDQCERNLRSPRAWEDLAIAMGERLRGGPIDTRIRRAASVGRPLPQRDMDFVFDCLWEVLGRDYVRHAVLYGTHDSADRLAATRLQARHLANEWLAAAEAEGLLCAKAYRQIRHYAVSVAVGRRLGEATRYEAAGEAGRALDARLSGGV